MHILQASAASILMRELHVHLLPYQPILRCLCCCCLLQGRFEAAIRDYTQAIQLNPGHCRAYYNRAFSHDRLGQFEEAVADYSRALQIEPANATALHNRGSLFERMGR
jgi:tetratricopeptide (TPR) repeat protein